MESQPQILNSGIILKTFTHVYYNIIFLHDWRLLNRIFIGFWNCMQIYFVGTTKTTSPTGLDKHGFSA